MDQKEEHNIDSRVPRLSHSVVKEAVHCRVQELVQRIENHPYSCRLAAEKRLQPIQQKFEGDDPRIELCETTPKNNVLTFFFIGIKELCTALLIYSESRRKFNKLRLDAISIPDNVIKKDTVMVLDMAKPKNRKSTKKPGMRGRDAARKLTLKVDILQIFMWEDRVLQCSLGLQRQL